MLKIDWSARSKNDLQELKSYIGQDSPHYARRFISRIISSVEQLTDFPELGRRVPEAENRNDIRELIHQGYRIIYLIETDGVSIIAIIHGSRDLSTEENKPWGSG